MNAQIKPEPTDRQGVTEAAGKLRKHGVIKYQRGHVTAPDREKLEDLSCECYEVVKTESDRLQACEPLFKRS